MADPLPRAKIVPAFVDPGTEARPSAEQRFVGDLHAAGVHGQQASLGQALHHPMHHLRIGIVADFGPRMPFIKPKILSGMPMNGIIHAKRLASPNNTDGFIVVF